MDKHPLSLKLYGFGLRFPAQPLGKSCEFLNKISKSNPFKKLIKRTREFLNKISLFKKQPSQAFSLFFNKGQVLIEGLFFMIFLLAFFLSLQFFQSLARKQIQKERLAKKLNFQKANKAHWFKPFKLKE